MSTMFGSYFADDQDQNPEIPVQQPEVLSPADQAGEGWNKVSYPSEVEQPAVQQPMDNSAAQNVYRSVVDEGTPFMDAYQKYIPNPVLSKEEQEKIDKRNGHIKNIGVFTDLAGLIGDALSARKGGPVKQRGSVTGKLGGAIQQYEKEYRDKIDRYGAGASHAAMQDLTNKIRSREQEARQRQWAAEQKFKEAKNAQDQKNWEFTQARGIEEFAAKYGLDKNKLELEIKKAENQKEYQDGMIGEKKRSNQIAQERVGIAKDKASSEKQSDYVVVSTNGGGRYKIPKNEWDSRAGQLYTAILDNYKGLISKDKEKLTDIERMIVQDLELMKSSFDAPGSTKNFVNKYANIMPDIFNKYLGDYAENSGQGGKPEPKNQNSGGNNGSSRVNKPQTQSR